MKEIKLKPETSKPKVLESAARAPKTAMREVWLKSKEKTVSELKETPFAGQNEESSNTPANSAANQTVSGMKTAAQKGADLTYRGGKKLAQTASRKVREKREASRVIKEEGGENDLLARIAGDPIFGVTLDELNAIVSPEKYVGRAPQQTEEFLSETVAPTLEKYSEIRDEKAEINV